MADLKADALRRDPDFYTSVQKILDTVERHSSKIEGIGPPNPALAQTYEETLETFNGYRGNPLFYPYLGSGLGKGALVELADGSVKYDFISGIGVHFGHSHPTILSALLQGAVEDVAMQGHLQQNRISFELTDLLLRLTNMDHGILCNSGAMANENALKIIFQKKAPAHRVLAFDRCFMGRTLALAQITDKPAFREGLPSTLRVDYIPFYDGRDPTGSTGNALEALEKLLKRHPGQYACMCFELIQGEAGSNPGEKAFFVALMQKLKEHSVAVLIDEVQTFGRTDCLLAYQSFGLEEFVDVVTIGKLMHTCATLFTSEFCPRPGLIAQTYTAATSSMYVAKAILNSLVNDGYLGSNGKNMQIRQRFVDQLEKIAQKHPDHFEGPFGRGLMIAATPFKGERERVIHYVQALFKAGVIAFIAGSDPTRIRFLVPAGGVTMEAIDHVCTILEEVLVQCQNP
ncbi:MAG: Acetylornithine/succinyldiaminopimelate aminotransferase [Chlamydiales bacterium]|nr:Acetylornithine/succinyldiaminopimelate aminotransferase [Chlamydiales bacterium]